MIASIAGIHIEPTNLCTLKCSGCSRTRFIDQWPQHWKNHNLNIDQVLNFLDIDLTAKTILLCGNYGDPIYHPDFINFVQKIKKRGIFLNIITNGSHRKSSWWQELTNELSDKDTVTFSIDGTPENFTQYRVNANWQSISTAIDVVTNSKCRTKWKYIPFSYNQNNITEMQHMSKDLGIDVFEVECSDRFDSVTESLRPSDELLGFRYQTQVEWKKNKIIKNIDPKCSVGNQHFITADGFYSPCCFLADHRFYYKTQFGKQKKQYNIQEHTLSQILLEPEVIDFYQNLNQQPCCQFNCPSRPETPDLL
jgi:MoaA/NifB/PqqE/SkfB family radical SAM enzyme